MLFRISKIRGALFSVGSLDRRKSSSVLIMVGSTNADSIALCPQDGGAIATVVNTSEYETLSVHLNVVNCSFLWNQAAGDVCMPAPS